MSAVTESPKLLSTRHILNTWWPLALSWTFIALEMPIQSAVLTRLPNPEINLAAYGSIVLPVALLLEAPILMLLSASTALSKDWDSYVRLRRFMYQLGVLLTGVHVLVTFTPLYYLVVEGIIQAPSQVVQPARWGLMIMIPFAFSIGFRRLNQGVLIRFGHSRVVWLGTFMRISANVIVLSIGLSLGTIPGTTLAAIAVMAGVLTEAVYVGVRVQPVLQYQVKWAPPVENPLTFAGFTAFYIPLAMTQIIAIIAEPLVPAALSRMPDPLISLAIWPVAFGALFVLQSLGVAFNEVVIALLDEPGAARSLRRFAGGLIVFTIILPLLVVITPASHLWFGALSGLPPALADVASVALAVGLLVPGLTVLCSWYQGNIVHSGKTRAISEAVVLYLGGCAAVLGLGIMWQPASGVYVGMAAVTVGIICQTAWLWWRSRDARRAKLSQSTGFSPVLDGEIGDACENEDHVLNGY